MAFENGILTSLTSDSTWKLFAREKKECECLIRNANLSMTAKSIHKGLLPDFDTHTHNTYSHTHTYMHIANDKRKVKRLKKVNPSHDTFQQ